MTYTYVELDVSPTTFHEIATKLRAAGYDQAFHDDGRVIDMHGIALVSEDPTHRVEKPDALDSQGRDVEDEKSDHAEGQKGVERNR